MTWAFALLLYSSTAHLPQATAVVNVTIIATIFIPLGFIAGLYGMNFDPGTGPLSMPELGWRYGYVAFWAMALVITVVLLGLMKMKKWW